MPSSRRRFLAGVTALSAAVAGCNENASRPVEETVTPVDVPRTDAEVLAEVTGGDRPSIPSPVVVSESHFEAALGRVESLKRSMEMRLDTVDEPVEFGDRVPIPDEPATLLENVESDLESARQTGRSKAALDQILRSLRSVATADGYLRASAGDLDAAGLRARIEDERTAAGQLRERFDYRVAEPNAYLPTVHEAEAILAGLQNLRHTESRIENRVEGNGSGSGNAEWAEERRIATLAEGYASIERRRLRRLNVDRYLETARTPEAPSRRTPLVAALRDLRPELEDVAARFGTGGSDRPEGDSVVGELEDIRWQVTREIDHYLSRRSATPEDGRLLDALVEGVRLVVRFRAFDAAVESTVGNLDGGEFPMEPLSDARREAVVAVERAADTSPLERQFTEPSAHLLRSGDATARRNRDRGDAGGDHGRVDARTLARVHLAYVGAAEWAGLGVDRGASLAATLQAQQS